LASHLLIAIGGGILSLIRVVGGILYFGVVSPTLLAMSWNTGISKVDLCQLLLMLIQGLKLCRPTRGRWVNGIMLLLLLWSGKFDPLLNEASTEGLGVSVVILELTLIALCFSPRIQDMLAFLLVDIPKVSNDAWQDQSDGSLSSLSKDLNELLETTDADVSEPGKPVCEMEFMQSLTTPSPPPPAYKQIKIRKGVLWHLLASFKRLLSFCLLVFGLSRLGGQGAEGLNVFYTAISEPIALEFGSHATVRLIGIPWRARRQIKRWSKRAAKNVTKKIADILPSPDILPTPPPVPSISQHANIFLRWMNPAVEARQWLIAENLDELVVNRTAPEVEPIKEERVSVDVKKCKSELNRGTSTFGLIQAV
jgi:hypothetical protein